MFVFTQDIYVTMKIRATEISKGRASAPMPYR